MDIITLSLAAKKALEKLGVKIEPGKVLTHDGKLAGKNTIEIKGFPYVQVSEQGYDLNNVTSVQIVTPDGTHDITADVSVIVLDDATALADSDMAYVVSTNGGVYVAHIGTEEEYEMMVARVEFSETIHPIDPKFIPGVVIDLADYGVDVIALFAQGGGTASLTNEDKLWELVNANADAPVTFHFKNTSMNMEMSTTATKTGTIGTISGLTATIPVRVASGYVVAYLWVMPTEVKLSLQAVS